MKNEYVKLSDGSILVIDDKGYSDRRNIGDDVVTERSLILENGIEHLNNVIANQRNKILSNEDFVNKAKHGFKTVILPTSLVGLGVGLISGAVMVFDKGFIILQIGTLLGGGLGIVMGSTASLSLKFYAHKIAKDIKNAELRVSKLEMQRKNLESELKKELSDTSANNDMVENEIVSLEEKSDAFLCEIYEKLEQENEEPISEKQKIPTLLPKSRH